MLFMKACRTAPSIIFIREIDAIDSKRKYLQRETDRRIVAQLLTCIDEPHRATTNGNNKKLEQDNRKPTRAREYLSSDLNDFDLQQYDGLAAISDGANKHLMLYGGVKEGWGWWLLLNGSSTE
ncbi:cell division cycle 48C [Tanacetum coccineum]